MKWVPVYTDIYVCHWQDEIEELRRHITWLSNNAYIDNHNQYADTFGYTLRMNHLGDLVSRIQTKNLLMISCRDIWSNSIAFSQVSLSYPTYNHEEHVSNHI